MENVKAVRKLCYKEKQTRHRIILQIEYLYQLGTQNESTKLESYLLNSFLKLPGVIFVWFLL